MCRSTPPIMMRVISVAPQKLGSRRQGVCHQRQPGELPLPNRAGNFQGRGARIEKHGLAFLNQCCGSGRRFQPSRRDVATPSRPVESRLRHRLFRMAPPCERTRRSRLESALISALAVTEETLKVTRQVRDDYPALTVDHFEHRPSSFFGEESRILALTHRSEFQRIGAYVGKSAFFRSTLRPTSLARTSAKSAR